MSADSIRRVIVGAAGKIIDAEEIMKALKAKGQEINQKSFYQAIKQVEKDDDIGVMEQQMNRHSLGKILKFTKKVWWYRG